MFYQQEERHPHGNASDISVRHRMRIGELERILGECMRGDYTGLKEYYKSQGMDDEEYVREIGTDGTNTLPLAKTFILMSEAMETKGRQFKLPSPLWMRGGEPV